jgi:ankyrin repeat protein
VRIQPRHLLLVTACIVIVAGLAAIAALWLRATAYDRLLAAIERGDARAVRREIARGVDVNRTTVEAVPGWDPLGKGNPVGGYDITGVTPLMKAALTGDDALVTALVEAGADVNAVTSTGATALQAAARGSVDGAAVRTLLESGADPQPTDQYGWTPLMDAAQWGRTEAARALIEHGADVLARDQFGTDALQYAVRFCQTDMVVLLLEAGADVDSRGVIGLTALTWIATGPSCATGADIDRIMQLLLDAGADVNAVDDEGLTPLMRAADGGSATAVRHLLGAGADPGRTDPAGRTAVAIARQWIDDPGMPDQAVIVELLESAMAP